MNNACDILLRLDLRVAAKSIGLEALATSALITEENLYIIINEIEIALIDGGKESQIASLCGLLWTHFGTQFNLLADYIFTTMTKIGFSPIGPMLSNAAEDSKRIVSSSLINMFETAAQMRRERLVVFGRVFHLTRFQTRLWKKINTSSHIAVSAPTSAGKSFLICLNLIHATSMHGGTSVYIVPTLTLMSQVANDLIKLTRQFEQSIDIRTHFDELADPDSPTIYVLTQERLADRNGLEKKITNLNYLIIDEVQNIERAFDFKDAETRSKLLLDVLIDLHDNHRPRKTVILGPRISEVSVLGETLFRRRCVPVTNISYALTPTEDGRVKLTQYSNLPGKRFSLTSRNTVGAVGFGKSRYDEDFHDFLSAVVSKNDSSLIFSPTSSQARKTALRLSGTMKPARDELLEELAKYIERTVSERYDLATCVRKGVAFHHGKMPHHVRNAVELAISEGMLRYVTCTTTLMQGVNLPARNVFMRNPNLFIQRKGDSEPRLSGYEVANLRGRAGRLLKDFVGRTFILDGTSFADEDDQASLFHPAQKELDGSYSGVFKRHREEIVGSLTELTENRSTLAKYIGNLLYTDSDGASKLLRKGIRLTDTELSAIKMQQRKFTVSRSICKNHRFWDPADLQALWDHASHFDLPTSPFDRNAASNLNDALLDLQELIPSQVEQYIGRNFANSRFLRALSITAIGWAAERPLRDLLSTDWARISADNTDQAISSLQKTVSYGIPSLLSPLYDMIAGSSSMLSAFERGAFEATSVMQINANVPRETAIAVTKYAKSNKVRMSNMDDVLRYLSKLKVTYWSAIQYRHLISISEITR